VHAPPGPNRPLEGILASLTAGLCRILDMTFREFVYYAVRCIKRPLYLTGALDS